MPAAAPGRRPSAARPKSLTRISYRSSLHGYQGCIIARSGRSAHAPTEPDYHDKITTGTAWKLPFERLPALFHAGFHRVLHILELFDFDVAQLAIHFFNATNVDRLNHIARFRID